MHWTEEPNKNSPARPGNVLVVDRNEPLEPAWTEYWKRILTEGAPLPIASRFSLAVDIYARTFQEDSTGQSTAKFNNSLNRQAEGIGTFHLRSEHFDLLQEKGEDDTVFGRRQLVWMLDHYRNLKTALESSEILPLYEKICSSHPLKVRLATINGWFDLQPGEKAFGTLPYEDQELLAGMTPAEPDPMEHLASGILTSPRTTAIEELTDALIQYTPPHFKNIHFTIKEGLEQGQRALFYEIESPEFPLDKTSAVNDRLHRAATLFVQQMSPQQGTFPGVQVWLSLQPDGSWRRTIEPIRA